MALKALKVLKAGMKSGYMLLFISFVTFFPWTMEVPIEGSTLTPDREVLSDHQQLHSFNTDDHNEHGKEPNENLNNQADRHNYSRMLTLSSTLGYDEWWYLTTRRPNIYLKDFPGRPGVATWKEISPGSSIDLRKSRKVEGPTAAGVSSGSNKLGAGTHYTVIAIGILFTISRLCWT